MSLASGTRLGPYEVASLLGRGGMGEVYRARDTRLDREVAIKVLPAQLGSSEEFQRRFEREAKTISQLQHPGICALHDVGREGDVHFLVMELLEGETLAERLARERLSLDEALDLGRQIAEGLAAAHRAGVVHRDLKPGNVMLTRSGAKLLDFGLAKAAAGEAGRETELTMAPTATSPITAAGVVVGTYQYMAPEVLEGAEADGRSDVFAFGATLYEMLTGRPAFEGKTQASVVAAILKETPSPVTESASAPPALERLVRRCLAKEPEDRWQSATDLAAELTWIQSGDLGAEAPAGVSGEAGTAPRLAWLLAALFAAAAIAFAGLYLSGRPGAPSSPRAIRFDVRPPEGAVLRSMFEAAAPPEISPDGRHVVFGVIDPEGKNQLWLRSLAVSEPRPLPGTEGAQRPFWSPDSRSLAFFTVNGLQRVEIAGGPPLTICPAAAGRGGTWNADGTIVFAPASAGPLLRVAAEGGEARPVTEIGEGEASHRYPDFLPDGRHFTYLVLSETGAAGTGLESEQKAMLGSLDGGPPRLLVRGVSNVVYADGHLVFRRGEALRAQPFDLERLELVEAPRALAPAVHYDAAYERAIFSVSEDVLVYLPGSYEGEFELHLRDRDGDAVREIVGASLLGQPRFSPDGEKVAFRLREGQSQAIWILDLERGTRRRLTFGSGIQLSPVWSRDGEKLAYGWNAGTGTATAVVSSSGEGEPAMLVDSRLGTHPYSWSPDGRYLLLQTSAAGEKLDILLLDLDEGAEPRPLLQTAHSEGMPVISPDGRWMAYVSDESGRLEVYVTRFPSLEGKHLVSSSGGLEPLWSGDGTSIFFRSLGQRVLEVPVEAAGDSFRIGPPRELFTMLQFEEDLQDGGLDFSPLRDRFVAKVIPGEHRLAPIRVVVGWSSLSP